VSFWEGLHMIAIHQGLGAFRGILASIVVAIAVFATANAFAVDATLTVVRAGSGSGAVTSNAGAINCGATCSDTYTTGTLIVLTAAPAAGNQFTGWLGPCTGKGACQFALNGATTAVATFAPAALGVPDLDIDGTDTFDALTDGLLVIRYLFGLTGPSLINNAVGQGASRGTEPQITGYLNDIRPLLDIDGNGQVDALTDGLLIIRYLFGLRGSSLINNAVGQGATRITAPDLEDILLFSIVGDVVPPDPASVAPPTDPTVVTEFAGATAFLYTGGTPIQTGVAPGTISPLRAAVLRGTVRARDGAPIPSVKITILGHPEFGQTKSRNDGAFDIAVNGGRVVTVNYQKTGYLPVQRQVEAPWRDYASLPDVVMIPLDSAVTTVNLATPAMQIAQGGLVMDSDGARRATLLIPQGTTANLVMPNGTLQPISQLSIRATEYTVGTNGPRTMPAVLPPSSGYTYAVELSADEAINAGATGITFNQPLFNYVDNFLGFPVGGIVPAGFYDRAKAAWVPSENGRVIKIVGATGGLADVESVGTGGLPPLTLSNAERQQLAALYSVGQELWRVPIPHFSAVDFNWPFLPPPDAISAVGVPGPTTDDFGMCPVQEPGSIIECQSQALGESIAIVGTPYTLNYRSFRTRGRAAAYKLHIPLSTTVPASLKRIELTVEVAGRTFVQSFSPTANQTATFAWDGLDAYARVLQGPQMGTVNIGYVYDGVYTAPSAANSAAFGNPGGTGLGITRTGMEITLARRTQHRIGATDAKPLGLGGWTLSPHHVYDPIGKSLLMGDGRRKTAVGLPHIIDTVGGGGMVENTNGIPATSARLHDPTGLVVAPDGSLYFIEQVTNRIRRIGPDGILSAVAGTGLTTYNGDNIPATSANIAPLGDLALAPDGSLYFAESTHRVRRIAPNGIISTVAGTGLPGYNGDGIPATQANLNLQARGGLAVAADGTLYVGESFRRIVRRVSPDGVISTFAGTGSNIYNGDGIPAIQAGLGVLGLAVAPDGSVLIADNANALIRRVGTDGIITTVAGNINSNNYLDGIPATQSAAGPYGSPVFGPDGSFYFPEAQFVWDVRRVGTDGIITTVAGGTAGPFNGDGIPAKEATLDFLSALAVGPDDSLYISTAGNLDRIRKVRTPLPGFSLSDVAVASDDGSVVYQFNAKGRHLRTVHALTGTTLTEFNYDGAGRLATVVEKTGGIDDITTIQRDGNGNPTKIIGPYGKETLLAVDGNGYLASITNPANESIQLVSNSTGLLQSMKDPRNKTTNFTFNTDGLLVVDADPGGGSQTLARTSVDNDVTVARTTAMSRVTSYKTEPLPGQQVRHSRIEPDGTQYINEQSVDAGSAVATDQDGTVSTLQFTSDPRFGMQAAFPKSVGLSIPSGPSMTRTSARTAVVSNPLDLLSVVTLTDTSSVAGKTATATYTAATKTDVSTSPAGRTRSFKIDSHGRLVQAQTGNLEPANFLYDSRGRLASYSMGTGGMTRTWTLTYNPQGLVATMTDPLTRTVQFAYDAAERIISKTLPDGAAIAFGYDVAGNLTSLTPPGRPAHVLAYSDRNEMTSVTPPMIAGTGPLAFAYNLDGQHTTRTRADDRSVTINYDASGRPSGRTFATNGVTTRTDSFSYDAAGGLASVSAASGITTSYGYVGPLLTSETWSGVIAGSVSVTYDDELRVDSQSVNGVSVQYQYDDDGLLIKAGGLDIIRHPQHELPTSTALGAVATTIGYNAFGEETSYGASANGSPIYGQTIVRDSVGRITHIDESIGGVASSYQYSYDTLGQLIGVTKNAVPFESYGYDPNGNRTSAGVGGGAIIATHDNQDRITQYGTSNFAYTPAGEVLTKTSGGQTTNYVYDEYGILGQVSLPGGTVIDYVIDGRGRRVGRKVNGNPANGFLYGDSIRPVAELDGMGNVVSRFVYAGVGPPAFFEKGGNTYRIIADHLGSVRLVVDVATGAIAQRIDYDSFGRVLADTNPGFQPFGFAGGLYDPLTGLVRFGVRDYAAEQGRWTGKDLIGFAGNDSNLYRYVFNDPLNAVDRAGLTSNHVWVGIAAGIFDAMLNTITGAASFPMSQEMKDAYNPIVAPIRIANQGGELFGYSRITGIDLERDDFTTSRELMEFGCGLAEGGVGAGGVLVRFIGGKLTPLVSRALSRVFARSIERGLAREAQELALQQKLAAQAAVSRQLDERIGVKVLGSTGMRNNVNYGLPTGQVR
jgi:RHS repeat-associated protein